MDEPDGFGAFVRASGPSLLRAGWLLTGNWASAEDLVQTALASAWQRWDRASRSPEGYVRAIMTTTYLSWRRRRWIGEHPTVDLPDRPGVDTYEHIDERHALQDVLAKLSSQQRAAIVLRYFADLSEADTAAAMGCSPGAVKSHTSRALARLRSQPGVAEILRGEVTS
ncbi:SigE family RNA polymerase sigma factor [uncultured Jatrophihabitans sp.]|uniref:SigE family RNA polymerase sigma factor n=1 Tax=uncultured Jatrophihabitans sp. TaxID=1610747 RepID=UPI0035CC9A5C